MVLTLAPFSGVNVTSKIALWEMPAIGKFCHARICYYVAETQEFSPFVELATVSLVTKSKTSAESPDSKESSLPFETLTSAHTSDCSTSSTSSFTTSAPFSESAASSPSPSSVTSSLSSEEVTPMDDLDALDLEGINFKHVLAFPVAAPLSDLLWRK
ncbi:hypothetical protein EV715DRAFT_297206 [Schizophyllum commune]